jgi:hypothetical protein
VLSRAWPLTPASRRAFHASGGKTRADDVLTVADGV